MSIFGAARRGLGMLGKLGKKKPVAPKAPSKLKTAKEKHDEFMQLDPFVRRNIISARESAKRGDVYKAGSVMGTPGPHRSAESIKKFWGKGTYQLTDPARKPRTRKFAGALVRGAKNIVKHTPWRKELAGLKKTHRTKQKILGARAGRAKQAKKEAGTARLYARHPEAKTMFAKQKFGRQFRKAGKR